MVSVGSIRFRMNHTFRYRDSACTTFGAQFIECCGFGTDAAIVCDVGAAHWRGEHTVTERDTCYRNRLAEIRIFTRKRLLNTTVRMFCRKIFCCSSGFGNDAGCHARVRILCNKNTFFFRKESDCTHFMAWGCQGTDMHTAKVKHHAAAQFRIGPCAAAAKAAIA